MEVSNLFVCLMGMGVTFIGLICLILLITLMGKIVGGGTAAKTAEPSPSAAPAAPAAPASVSPAVRAIPNRGELVAAVSAAIAEDLGTDISAIRILSLTPVGSAAYAVPNRGEVVAAVSAAIAEELGTDVSAIRVLSMRQAA